MYVEKSAPLYAGILDPIYEHVPRNASEALNYVNSPNSLRGLLPRQLGERMASESVSGVEPTVRQADREAMTERRGEQEKRRGTLPAASSAKSQGTAKDEDDTDEYPDHCGDLATFIEGRQVIEWDIPVFNGIIHVLGSSVLRPDIEALATNIAFWQCTHQFCYECPLLTPFFLKFLDEIGIITGKKPFEFNPPPGVRPDWVCRGAFSYYPAGWTKQTWHKYLETMSSTDKRTAKRNADLVARAAEGRYQIALLYESIRLQSIEARRRYDPLRPISDETYDPNFKNMKKSFYDKNFECKGEAVNRELTAKQMHKIIPAVYPWTG
ncbi:uncharacterized protein LOC34620077 [Cyclospora cayetanensis]|uniref:Uncharacterized protein LOC34620077 n=1 Tax=Cyclospora cayetanensis TaxID=88456 RepID=A0A6P6RTZ8_9EIME|nr:uncharacterized protein LOC34620077 [Cyclospora cayetanensis]